MPERGTGMGVIVVWCGLCTPYSLIASVSVFSSGFNRSDRHAPRATSVRVLGLCMAQQQKGAARP